MTQHATPRLPAEWEPHERTIMSWPTARIWEEDARYVRKDIARLARVLGESEPVMLLASPDDAERAARACGPNVEVVPIPVDDLWARDTVPVCVDSAEGILGVDLNFNGWGGKQPHDHDAAVAERILDALSIPRTQARIVAEGGSLESDGAGTLLVTESSVVNPNRNPGRTRDELEAELRALLGVSRVVWFDGVVGADITDAHVDSLARFTAPGVVLLDVAAPGAPKDVWSRSAEQARGVLSRERDARGAAFDVVDLPQPDLTRIRANSDEFLASYVNFFVGNEVVLVPEFGDRRADRRARAILSEHFPSREVVAVRIDEIAAGGGGIHCATREVPSRSSVSGM
ncbi:agmatine deiminase family protein [Leucobacter sp. G161]|uniref:agmatine deiminase family protein n=1 Tax=Leucobacter sp. G161 TaxID=663704 RepID=UPI00073D029F|nr:agmatine deiminase family protein [Leucobacter sp. G161]KUF05814.1 peptidyl-arginine deiminase [Leucobacter sp. G161]